MMMEATMKCGKWPWSFWLLLKHPFWLVVFAILLLVGCEAAPQHVKGKTTFRLRSFSPDNNILSLDYCQDGSCCEPMLLDLHSGEGVTISSQDTDQRLSSGTYSPDGKYLVFVVKRKSEEYRWSQLGLYDVSTKSLKILTQTQSLKSVPSFSPDCKKIIYASPARERKSGKTTHSRWDIYELDTVTGNERQLTHYEFFMIGRPFYMPDGKQFIFSGDSPHYFQDKVGMEAAKAYRALFQDNRIFIMERGVNELKPAFINGPLTEDPQITRDGSRIAYIARSSEMNRAAEQQTRGYSYDIFTFDQGTHSRWTNIDLVDDNMSDRWMYHDYVMSLDGSLFAYSIENLKNRELKLWLMDINEKTNKQITISPVK